jgi:osmoprotectant transport system permease protein
VTGVIADQGPGIQAEPAADQASGVPAERGAAKATWKGLLIQPIAIGVVFLGFVIWLNTADLTRRPLNRASGVILAISNVGQAAPAIGLVVLLAFWLGFTFWTAVVALVAYAILPVLRNTMIGVQSVDAGLVEAGRGMGMSSFAVLLKVELPLAVPVMLSGIRTALVLLVGAAALATFIGAGGLGLLITTGVNLFLPRVLVSGALLIALLALLIDWLGRIVEFTARPKGLR